jgi:hypothetical protein
MFRENKQSYLENRAEMRGVGSRCQRRAPHLGI